MVFTASMSDVRIVGDFATYYHAQVGLPDIGCAIKQLVVCWVVLFGQKRRDLRPLSGPENTC